MRLLNCMIIFVAAGLLLVNFTVSQWTTTPGWNFTNTLLNTTTPMSRWLPSTTVSAATCYGVVILRAAVNSTGRIYSPRYPNGYPSRTTCQWRISADEGHVVDLVVREASIENCSRCNCDKVIIYDGSSSSVCELYRICMTVEPNFHVYGTRQDMFITFTSDAYVSGRGFVLEYLAEPDRNGSRRASYFQALTNETKEIYSPGHPGGYPNRINCSWQIRADDGYVVQLTVIVELEECRTCSCDQLQIFDASDNSHGRRIRQYCSSYRRDVVYTTQQYAFLTFTSDGSISGKGFVITYKAVTYDPAFYQTTQTTERTTISTKGHFTFYQSSVYQSSPTYDKGPTTSLVMIIVSCLTGLSMLLIFVVLILYLVKRRQARQLNTYSNLPPPPTGASVTVTSTTVPPMYYYHPNSGVVVAGPGVVYPAQSAPPAFKTEAFTPDLIPTSNQSLPPQTGQ